MTTEYRKGAHTVYDIKYHFVWVTKYRYHVLRGEIAERARDLIRQVCGDDLPENMIGRFMVFKTWDRLSYGLVLDSARELDIGDKVRNP